MMRIVLRGILSAILLPAMLAGCSSAAGNKDKAMVYQVRRPAQPVRVDGDWNNPAWSKAATIELTGHMGNKPEHFPRTQARIMYDDEALYVIFRVEDKYVRAVARKHQDSVCRDSCVEFFFTPGTDVSVGYFNLEMNCGGTMLFNWQVAPGKDRTEIKPADIERIQVAHSMPRNVDPEIAEPTTWTVEYRMPFEILKGYCPTAEKPAPGVVWRANVYKCGDATSHPHWLTWSPVQFAHPRFHLPEFFGSLEFK